MELDQQLLFFHTIIKRSSSYFCYMKQSSCPCDEWLLWPYSSCDEIKTNKYNKINFVNLIKLLGNGIYFLKHVFLPIIIIIF